MKHYQRLRKHGSTADPSPLIDNWRRYRKSPTGCWIWKGPVNPKGYGIFSRPEFGTTVAHRCFYVKHVGPIAGGLQVDHLCRVPSCVNPEHLELVTHEENQRRGHEARHNGLCGNGLHDITGPDAWHIKTDGARHCRRCWLLTNRVAGGKYRSRMKRETGSTRPRHPSPPFGTDN